jgi:hypothetical protein
MEGVWTLGRFVVDKRIIPSPSEVLLRHEVPYDSVVSGTAMFFVLTAPIVGVAVAPQIVVSGATKDDIRTLLAVKCVATAAPRGRPRTFRPLPRVDLPARRRA